MYVDVLEIFRSLLSTRVQPYAPRCVRLQADVYRQPHRPPCQAARPSAFGLSEVQAGDGWQGGVRKVGTLISRMHPFGCFVLSVSCSTKPEPLPGRPFHEAGFWLLLLSWTFRPQSDMREVTRPMVLLCDCPKAYLPFIHKLFVKFFPITQFENAKCFLPESD